MKHEEAGTTAWHGSKRARANTTTSGVLLAIAAVPFGVVYGSIQELREAPLWLSAGTGAISLLFLFAGAIIMRHIGLGRILATSGIVGTLVLGAPHLSTSPPAALSALVAATATLVLLWKVGAPLIEFSRDRQRPMLEGQTQGAAMAALGLWLVSTFTPFDQILDGVVLSWGMGLSSALCLQRSSEPLWLVPRLTSRWSKIAGGSLCSVTPNDCSLGRSRGCVA